MPEAEAPKPFAKGALVNERYELLELVETDDSISVWEAVDRQTNEKVAIKTLETASLDPTQVVEAKERFLREGKVCRLMKHEHIDRVFAVGGADAAPYLVMEWHEGTPLDRSLQEKKTLPVGHALVVALKVARALTYAHGLRIYHRDLKPHNILFQEDGGVKITNFGLAKKLDDAMGGGVLTRPGKILGTLGYLAPEYIERGQISSASDLYSLGVVMYEMLTGELPFQGKTPLDFMRAQFRGTPELPSRKNPDVSATLDAVVLKCLSKAPKSRYASGSELLHDLGSAASLKEAPVEEDKVRLAGVYYQQALEAFSKSDNWACIQLCTAATRTDSKRADFYVLLGRAQGRISKWRRKAVTSLERAVAMDDTMEEAWVELARTYAEQGMKRAAIKKLNEFLNRQPEAKQAAALLKKITKKG
ncbi:MAG: protein kinase [Acidobacteriota bacterium]|nr:MAG: protein kinase [Acidobacteriota bacterium]